MLTRRSKYSSPCDVDPTSPPPELDLWLEVGALDNTTNADYGKTQNTKPLYSRIIFQRDQRPRDRAPFFLCGVLKNVRRGHAEMVEFAVSVHGGWGFFLSGNRNQSYTNPPEDEE